MASKTIKTVAIIILALALLISVIAIYKKSYVLGGVGFAASIFLLIWAFGVETEPQKIPLHEIIKAYKEYLHEYFRLSIPEDIKLAYNEERMENYVLVLAFKERETETEWYFPFEANKFTGEFCRGTGQYYHDAREVEFWINKDTKLLNEAELVGKKLSDKMAQRLKEELEFREITREGGDDNDGRRTQGG